MTEPRRVKEFHELTDRVTDLLEHVGEEWQWLYHAAYDRTVGEKIGKSPIWESDPTSDVALGRLRMRNHLKRTERELRRIQERLTEQASLLQSSLEALDPKDQPAILMPRTVYRDELEVSREAKKRRQDRGEDFGASPLPRVKEDGRG